MPRTPDPTPESRLAAAERRAIYLATDLHECQKQLKAAQAPKNKPKHELEELHAMRTRLDEAERRMAEAEKIQPNVALTSLAVLHLIELTQRCQAAGISTAPGDDVLGDISPWLQEVNQQFIAIRTEQAKPKRRTRKPKETSHANSI